MLSLQKYLQFQLSYSAMGLKHASLRKKNDQDTYVSSSSCVQIEKTPQMQRQPLDQPIALRRSET